MTGGQLQDARQDARAAVDRYDSLDRSQRMDAGTLKERAVEIRAALSSLVDATQDRFADSMPQAIEERVAQARQALDEYDDPTQYDQAQHVVRACYVLRQETNALIGELEQPA